MNPVPILIATRNCGKLDEFRVLLAGLPLRPMSIDEVLPSLPEVVEDGATLADNSRKKATVLAEESLMLTLADDTGLEVDALGGQPGVRSARYAGETATESDNNRKLLAAITELGDVGELGPLTARFRCVITIIDPYQRCAPLVSEGTCEGYITRSARGTHGFGYDSLFVVEGSGGRTLAELAPHEKNVVSHRAQALLAVRESLESLLRGRNLLVSSIR